MTKPLSRAPKTLDQQLMYFEFSLWTIRYLHVNMVSSINMATLIRGTYSYFEIEAIGSYTDKTTYSYVVHIELEKDSRAETGNWVI